MLFRSLPGSHLAHMAQLRINQLPESAAALREFRHPSPIPVPPYNPRQEALSAVGELGLKEAPPAVLGLAKDRNAEIRQQVASAVGRIGDPKGVPALRELLTDENKNVRESAVNALSEIRDRSALEALVGALKSTDPTVRRAAAEALGQRED